MKPITIRVWVPEETPDPITDGSRLAAEQLGILAAQPDAAAYVLSDRELENIADGNSERAYRDTINSIIADVKGKIAAGTITNEDEAREYIEQMIDGHHDVIYTACAQDILRHSKNDEAYFAEGLFDARSFRDGIPWSQLAYFALLADVMGEIGDLVDLFETDEDEDEETADTAE